MGAVGWREGVFLLLFVLLLAPPRIAVAGSVEDKLAEIERENALLRKQNAALREQARLLAENAELQKRARTKQTPAPPAAGERIWSLNEPAKPDPAAAPVERVLLSADLPAAYAAGIPLKAPLIVERGRFQAFVEGGAFWTGGEPVRATFETAASDAVLGPQGRFDLIPRRGWDAAVGFDYKFAASPWHVSGQFRYGQTNASDSAASSFGPVISHPFGPLDFVLNATGQAAATLRETHWLADFAVGRDLSVGPDAMQVKVGVRVAEIASNLRLMNTTDLIVRQFPTTLPGFFAEEVDTVNTTRNATFRGAGPRIGVDGAIPFAAGWEFDYLAGVAALFGYRRFDSTTVALTNVSSNIPGLPSGPSGDVFSFLQQKAATVANVDMQVGVAYWVNPAFKLSASYRLDAYFAALMDGNLNTMDRYFHGPRVAGTVSF